VAGNRNAYRKEWRRKRTEARLLVAAKYGKPPTWRERNREYLREATRRWKHDNKEREAVTRKLWEKRNREKRRRQQRGRRSNPDVRSRCNLLRALNRQRLKNKDPEALRMLDALNRYRRRTTVGTCSVEQWKGRLIAHGYRCFYCKRKLGKGEITTDHVVPLARNGTGWPSNLVPACKPCNCAKKKTPWKVFLSKVRQCL
jgi:5-methylcytosine-specific restriction endonuclease McrA